MYFDVYIHSSTSIPKLQRSVFFTDLHVYLILSPCAHRGFSSVFNMLVELKKVRLFNDLASSK